jgi:hypothetical protein
MAPPAQRLSKAKSSSEKSLAQLQLSPNRKHRRLGSELAAAAAAAAAALSAYDGTNGPPLDTSALSSTVSDSLNDLADQVVLFEGCVVLKFVASRLLVQSEQFANELTRHVGICAPDSRIMRSKVWACVRGGCGGDPLLCVHVERISMRAGACTVGSPEPLFVVSVLCLLHPPVHHPGRLSL